MMFNFAIVDTHSGIAPGNAGQRPDLPHGEGALHPPRGPNAALWNGRNNVLEKGQAYDR